MERLFVAYPAEPAQIGATIEAAAVIVRGSGTKFAETWRQIDIPGRFLTEGILRKIEDSTSVVVDATRLNFNVTFEAAYALALRKRLVVVVNRALSPERKELDHLGIYDTLGYKEYENSRDLADLLLSSYDQSPIEFPSLEVDKGSPIYVLDTLHKNDASIRILSKIKKARIQFRSFDPTEQSRLSTLEAFRGVSKSIAVVVNLISSRATDHRLNNLRGAFLAGLSWGLRKETLLLQESDDNVPLDIRDFVSVYKHPDDVDKYLNDLFPKVAEGLQEPVPERKAAPGSPLSRLDLAARGESQVWPNRRSRISEQW